MPLIDLTAALRDAWDVIVIGTGVGGATAGYTLARAGMKVLFCERGHWHHGEPSKFHGNYPELLAPDAQPDSASWRQAMARSGRCADVFEDGSRRRHRRFVPLLGSGVGGSSALYGMAMERFFPCDFEPGRHHNPDAGSMLPERWPIGFTDMLPYYLEAEELYGVRGTMDPLKHADSHNLPAAPPLTPGAETIFELLRDRGCHPYRLPLACRFSADCACCQGFQCR